MAEPTSTLKITLPEKVVPMPTSPTHQWYWDNISAYRDLYNRQFDYNKTLLSQSRFDEINVNSILNDPYASARNKQYYLAELNAAKAALGQFAEYFQNAYYVNQMSQENYNMLASLKTESEKAAAAQQKTIETLTAQRDYEMGLIEQAAQQQKALIEKQRSEQQAAIAQQQQVQNQQIQQQELNTQALSSSMRVLASMQSQSKAPTAQMTKRQSASLRIRPTSPTQSLRIGSSGRSSGVGVNLGG